MSSLIRFSIPLTLSFLVNMLYSLIDRWFISRLGTEAIAAFTKAEPLTFLVFTIASGFCMGAGVIIARRIGEGDRDGADRTATQAIVFIVGASLLITVVLYFALPYAVGGAQVNPVVARLANDYLKAILLGFCGNILSFMINAIVRSAGNPVYPTIILLLTTVINAILAPIFILWLDMGLWGAGLATALAQIIGAVINLVNLLRGKAGIRFRFDALRIDWGIISKILALGFPSTVQMMVVAVTRVSITKIIEAHFGTAVLAAYGLGVSLDFVVFMFIFSTGIAVEIATGQNLGAGKPERVFAYHRAGMKALTAVIVFLGALIYLFGSSFTSLYSSDALVIAETQKYFHVSVFGYLFFAIGVVSARVISGSGAAYMSLLIVGGSILFLQLPLIYLLSTYTGWGQVGMWIGAAAGYALFAAIALASVQGKRWLKAKV